MGWASEASLHVKINTSFLILVLLFKVLGIWLSFLPCLIANAEYILTGFILYYIGLGLKMNYYVFIRMSSIVYQYCKSFICMHQIHTMPRTQMFSMINITNYLSLVHETNDNVWTKYYLSHLKKYIKEEFVPKSLLEQVSKWSFGLFYSYCLFHFYVDVLTEKIFIFQ